jgi:hypothetical protein
VLVGVDDVEPGLSEEATDRGDQPGAVRAGEQQARCRLLGDPRIMPGRASTGEIFRSNRRATNLDLTARSASRVL